MFLLLLLLICLACSSMWIPTASCLHVNSGLSSLSLLGQTFTLKICNIDRRIICTITRSPSACQKFSQLGFLPPFDKKDPHCFYIDFLWFSWCVIFQPFDGLFWILFRDFLVYIKNNINTSGTSLMVGQTLVVLQHTEFVHPISDKYMWLWDLLDIGCTFLKLNH